MPGKTQTKTTRGGGKSTKRDSGEEHDALADVIGEFEHENQNNQGGDSGSGGNGYAPTMANVVSMTSLGYNDMVNQFDAKNRASFHNTMNDPNLGYGDFGGAGASGTFKQNSVFNLFNEVSNAP